MQDKQIMSNHTLRKTLRVQWSSIHGRGLFARDNIRKGTYVGTYDGPATQKNGTYVLWVKNERGNWRGRDGKNMLRYLNHNTKPNAEFDGHDLFSIKLIKAGQEITFDYGEEPA
ncbi:MAG: SET domain-containing protein [Parasphingorhabdus sp.]|jgi:SET domain-containing protein